MDRRRAPASPRIGAVRARLSPVARHPMSESGVTLIENKAMGRLIKTVVAVALVFSASGCSGPFSFNGPMSSDAWSGEQCAPASSLPATVGIASLTATRSTTITAVKLIGASGITSTVSSLIPGDGPPLGVDADPPRDFSLNSIGPNRWKARRNAVGADISPGQPAPQLVLQITGAVGKADSIEVEYSSGNSQYTLSIPRRLRVASPAC